MGFYIHVVSLNRRVNRHLSGTLSMNLLSNGYLMDTIPI